MTASRDALTNAFTRFTSTPSSRPPPGPAGVVRDRDGSVCPAGGKRGTRRAERRRTPPNEEMPGAKTSRQRGASTIISCASNAFGMTAYRASKSITG
jgi:hypothetical protein